jgi:hypothetical protein
MKELNEYRAQLIERLVRAAGLFREICLGVNDPFLPLEEDGWNVHQVAAHTRDVNALVYGFRARRTAVEDNPEFLNFDGDVYMSEKYNADEPLGRILDDFVENVAALADDLRRLPAGAWARESRHSIMGGGFTLQNWVERDLAHIEEHLETVRKCS